MKIQGIPSVLLVVFAFSLSFSAAPNSTVAADPAAAQPTREFECQDRPDDLAEPPDMQIPSAQDRRGKPIDTGTPTEPEPEPLCPEGQLPIPREQELPKGNPFYSGTAFDAPYNYAGVWSSAGGTIRPFDGGGVVSRVESPAISSAGGTHSLFEISVQGGEGDGNIVEIGWTVDVSDNSPRLFVFHWTNWNPSCYNGCGWVQWNPSIVPGMTLIPGSENYMGWVYYEPQGNWWAWYNNQWVGYYPGRLWEEGFTRSTRIQWFAEVYETDPTPESDMGNGIPSTIARAARFWFPCEVESAAWVCWINPGPTLNQPSLPWYTMTSAGGFAYRYGGPGGRDGAGEDP